MTHKGWLKRHTNDTPMTHERHESYPQNTSRFQVKSVTFTYRGCHYFGPKKVTILGQKDRGKITT